MTRHVPVLSQSVLQHLSVDPADTVVDGTVGSGGHAQAICTQLNEQGHLIGIDKDKTAIKQARKTLQQADCTADVCLQTGSFARIKHVLDVCDVQSVSSALLDLGFRSGQLAANRGFSFQRDDPLLMTYKHPEDISAGDITAQEILNQWSQESIASILDGYANEQFAESIAEAIVESRQQTPIETTKDLTRIVKAAVPQFYRRGSRHPATKTFQAVRMAVNDEVRTLQSGLQAIFDVLEPGGRLVVISFHSVEDRIVKQFIEKQVAGNAGEAITDSPVTPDETEVSFNPRARSAKLRCLQKQSTS